LQDAADRISPSASVPKAVPELSEDYNSVR
jgi:hypothetical protein